MNRRNWGDDQRATWQLFLTVSVQLMDRLDDELQHHHELAMLDYQILSGLLAADTRRLRMSELADDVLVSRSRLTYRIDRLVETGFVVREECEDDRRGMWAIITEAGVAALSAARIGHEAAIDAWFFDQIPDEELDGFRRSLQRIAVKLSQGEAS